MGELTKPPTPFLQGSPGKTGPRGGVVSIGTSASPASRPLGRQGWLSGWGEGMAGSPPQWQSPRRSESWFSVCRATQGWPASQERKARR